MAQTHRLDVTPAGEFHLSVERPSAPVALLERLWREATHFALVRTGKAIVDEADVLTPTAELRRLVAAAAPLRSFIEDARWASEWPGTQRGGANFWLRGRAAGVPPFPLDERTVWRGWGEWEDLQLYKGSSLLFYVCSHEGFGEAWGPERLLHEPGLHAKRRTTAEAYQVLGMLAAPALLESLTAEEPRR